MHLKVDKILGGAGPLWDEYERRAREAAEVAETELDPSERCKRVVERMREILGG